MENAHFKEIVFGPLSILIPLPSRKPNGRIFASLPVKTSIHSLIFTLFLIFAFRSYKKLYRIAV